MRTRPRPLSAHLVLGLFSLALALPQLPAATVLWSGSAGELWETPANWNTSTPWITNSVSIIQGGSYTVFVTNSTADSSASMLTITNLLLGNTADDAPRLLVNYTNPSVVFRIATSLTLGTGGATSTLEVASGSVQVDGTLRLGASGGSHDTMLIRGGSVTSTNLFQIANGAGSTSSVIVAEGGALYLTNRGGNATANYAAFGRASASVGSLFVSGGTVRVQNKAWESNTYFYVGHVAAAKGEMYVSSGDVDVNGAWFTIGSAAGSTGLVVVSGGKMTVTNEMSNAGYFRVGASGNATMIISNTGYVAADRLAIAYGAGGVGLLVISDGGMLEMTGDNYLKASILGGTGSFTNMNGGTLRFTLNAPDLQFTNPGVVRNATIEFKGVDAADISGVQLAKFSYEGNNTLRLNAATNKGSVSYTFGTNLNPAYATLDLVNAGVFRATNFTVATGGKITGTGTILANTATNFGTLSPGHSPGTLTFSSNLTLGAASVLNIELGGTNAVDFDHLVVGGAFNPGGTLNITLTNGYTPTSGDVLDILDWGSILGGTFSTINLPSAQWSAGSLYTDGTLIYAAIPEPGAALVLSLGLGLLMWARRERKNRPGR